MKPNDGALERAAGALPLAAAPVFAVMAWLAAASTAEAALCMDPSGAHSMSRMYALMALFHAGPWLRLPGRFFPLIRNGPGARAATDVSTLVPKPKDAQKAPHLS